jgi:hypothetical protein
MIAGLMLCILAIPVWTAESDSNPRNLLTGKYSKELLLQKMLAREEWNPFPPAKDRAAWDALLQPPLNRERRASVTAHAEALLGKPWPALPATLYMEYARDGNRSRYQVPYFERRTNLGTLVLAECMEHRGRFLDEIANGIWALCEESTWCLPAHAERRPGDVLHRLDLETLDLFACETGMLMAQVDALLHDELTSLSPALTERIAREVKRRILDPYAAGDGFGRSGWIQGGNNWSPWCASNVMYAAMLLETDRDRLAAMTFRLMQVVDRFINNYGPDGGCDEGPGYWNEAGGAMLVFLELLRSRTNGAVDIYGEPKIAAMGRFITDAHLDGPWFANFSDADARTYPHAGKVYRFGERVGSDAMKDLALLVMRDYKAAGPVDPPLPLSRIRPLLGPLMELFWIPTDAKPSDLPRPRTAWYPNLEMLFARESERPGQGLVLAAKGGHNAESHNHNDSGQFILVLDGQPAIIDVGRGEYTRDTFSSRRYELWFTRGLSHNAPVVNGVEQAPGLKFRATQVQFEDKESGCRLAMNLEQAYPPESGLASLRREFEFQRSGAPGLVVRDRIEMKGDAKGPGMIQVNLYTPQPVKQLAPGRLSIACKPRALLLDFDANKMKTKIEPVDLTDPDLRENWGERLYRIALETEIPRAGEYALRFHAD